ncbi:MAG: ribosome maturation factor RimP [Alphaproteobacteria bacterium]|nr:ribosome maturation factor RimP [Alphaproteobacteria bacterium]
MVDVARIEGLIAPSLAAMGFAIVRVRFLGGARRATLQIMVERALPEHGVRLDDGGISADDCAEVSRTVSALLDVEDPIAGAYELEISSPGIDRPLLRPADFRRYRGFAARLETRLPIDGRRRFAGTLDETDTQHVRLIDPDGAVISVPFAAIHAAKLQLTDHLLQEVSRLRSQAQTKEEAL